MLSSSRNKPSQLSMISDAAAFCAGNDVTITISPQYLRTLDQFEDRKELLYALSDAIARQYFSSSGFD